MFDELATPDPDLHPCVSKLSTWASGRPVLELGIGTGRVALELARYVTPPVHGIDVSETMLSRLASRKGATSICAWRDDFANFTTSERYGLVYILASTFFMLLTRVEQERCFAAVAACLLPGGSFVVECEIPPLHRFERNQLVEVASMDTDALDLLVARHKPAEQRIDYQRVRITEAGTRLLPLCYRYALPAELDEMASLSSLILVERAAGWRDEPFEEDSRYHVSRYAAATSPTRSHA